MNGTAQLLKPHGNVEIMMWVAYCRKTVRPGMMAHALQDLLAIFAGH